MTIRERELLTMITLMEEESKCLRSVLSEWTVDKYQFTQWVRANILREAIETLVHKL